MSALDSITDEALERESPRDFAASAFFWKGRVALYAILRTLGIGPGYAVVVPGYTCVVVPSAIHFVGATPLYADIDPATYNLTLAEIERVSHSQPVKAVVVQHTYGLPADVEPIFRCRRAARAGHEDCCYALGSRYRATGRGAAEACSNQRGRLAGDAALSAANGQPIITGLRWPRLATPRSPQSCNGLNKNASPPRG